MTPNGQSVLVIEPSRAAREKVGKLITELGYEPRLSANVLEAHALFDHSSAVIAAHPGAAEIYPRLRATGIPLIATFHAKQTSPQELAGEIGADAFLLRPYRSEPLGLALYVASVARRLREKVARPEGAVPEVDEKNRINAHVDLFKTLLPLEIRRARRHGYPIAICVVSLDPLPDAHHVSPDIAAACEPLLRRAVRDVDLLVPYGEGRFLVFLPHTDGRGADTVGKRIVSEIRSCRFKTAGIELMVTASVGIASPKNSANTSFSRLIRDAHAAVRAAQLKGGDRAIVRQ